MLCQVIYCTVIDIGNRLLRPQRSINAAWSYWTIWDHFCIRSELDSFSTSQEIYCTFFQKKSAMLKSIQQITGDEKPNLTINFQEVIMIGFIQKLKKYFVLFLWRNHASLPFSKLVSCSYDIQVFLTWKFMLEII